MKKYTVVPFSEFERRQRARRDHFGSAPHHLRDAFRDTTAALLTAAAHYDVATLSRVVNPDDNLATRTLKTTPYYMLMRAVFENKPITVRNMAEFYRINDLNSVHYWHFPGETTAHFLTPAHLVRTVRMAESLTSLGTKFSTPDTEGFLPLHYIRRFALDENLVDHLADQHGIDKRKTILKSGAHPHVR